jgi:hypothetical protein
MTYRAAIDKEAHLALWNVDRESQQAPSGVAHVGMVGLHPALSQSLKARPSVDDSPIEAMGLVGIKSVQNVAMDV